jgi:hypothetical protein
MIEGLNVFLSIEDSKSLCLWDKTETVYADVDFDAFVRDSFIDMPPTLAIEWAAKLETFAYMLRTYAAEMQPAVCFPSSGMEGE